MIPNRLQHAPLDLQGPIEYGIPRTGWLFYQLRGKREKSIVAGKLVLSVTDGTGVVSEAIWNT
jgi:hypothetical protein